MNREPQLNLRLDQDGRLWAEGTGPNGMRRKFEVSSLAELRQDLEDQQAQISRREAIETAARHTRVYLAVAEKHNTRRASQLIGGRVPQAIWSALINDGYTAAEIAMMREKGELEDIRFTYSVSGQQAAQANRAAQHEAEQTRTPKQQLLANANSLPI